jgi:hypothetical protein
MSICRLLPGAIRARPLSDILARANSANLFGRVVPGRSRALSGPSILAEKVGVADLGCPGFEILSGFVVLLRQTTERDL